MTHPCSPQEGANGDNPGQAVAHANLKSMNDAFGKFVGRAKGDQI
jgi:hypothetical protein